MELLFFGGECLFGDQLPLLKAAFPRAVPRSLGYAGVDAGLLGEAVPGADPRAHRAFTPYTAIEILDDCGQPVDEEGIPGRLVVTDLRRRLMPVLRYPAGDRAAWVDREAGVFRILGRTEEGVRVGPVCLHTQDVHDIVTAADPDGEVTGLQLVIRRQGGRDGLVLRLATAEPLDHRPQLRHRPGANPPGPGPGRPPASAHRHEDRVLQRGHRRRRREHSALTEDQALAGHSVVPDHVRWQIRRNRAQLGLAEGDWRWSWIHIAGWNCGVSVACRSPKR